MTQGRRDEDVEEILDLDYETRRLTDEVESLESQIEEHERVQQKLEAKVGELEKQVDLFGNIVKLAKQIAVMPMKEAA